MTAAFPHTPPRSADASTPATAIIGAGLAGLACAELLATAGRSVTIFDKGRGPGGRLSTRRVEPGAGAGSLTFDHGGQYLTARDPAFRQQMDRWCVEGMAAPWPARIVRLDATGGVEESPGERFVGIPGMNSLIRALAAGLPHPPAWGVTLAAPERTEEGWTLRDADGRDLGRFDQVVVAAPAPQATVLLAGAPDLAVRAAGSMMAPCWTVMAAFAQPLDLPWQAAFVAGEDGISGGTEARPLTWVAQDSSKPGRILPSGIAETWVLHGGPGWSARHLEEPADRVRDRLLAAFRDLTGAGEPVFATAHRWRYALPTAPLGEGFLWDAERGIGACGDWCAGARGEAAWISGRALGRHLTGGGKA